jgi:hypothetical protein
MNNGRMEYWNGGQKNIVIKPIIPSFQYSNLFPLRLIFFLSSPAIKKGGKEV